MNGVNRLSRCIQCCRYFFACSFITLFAAQAKDVKTATKSQKILYPTPESSHDSRIIYPIKLLELALSKLDDNYELIPYRIGMAQGRALRLLKQEQGVDVVWTMTNKQREREFLPIRIPIYKGLSGWRLLLIKSQRQTDFHKVTHLADLTHLEAGQGHDWPDAQILRSNGLTVQTTPNYEGLFLMLDKERFDYFPRMVTEIWQELAERSQFDFVVEDSLVLHYPTAIYYFVKKQNTALAEEITQGLNMAMSDGSLDALFTSLHERFIDDAALKQRKVIKLANPLLPPSTPLDIPALWFQP